jgi:hypothetical protein
MSAHVFGPSLNIGRDCSVGANRRHGLTSARRRMLMMGGCDNLQILFEKCRCGPGPDSGLIQPKPWSSLDAG